jgi:hypothetical protein
MKTIALGYAGNKRNEVELYYDITERVDLYDMEYIVELCGTRHELLHSHTPPVRI